MNSEKARLLFARRRKAILSKKIKNKAARRNNRTGGKSNDGETEP